MAVDIMLSGCLSVRTYISMCVPVLWTQNLRNISREFLQIQHKHSLGFKDDRIRFRWSKVKDEREHMFFAITEEFIH